jgi:hypothetical protein
MQLISAKIDIKMPLSQASKLCGNHAESGVAASGIYIVKLRPWADVAAVPDHEMAKKCNSAFHPEMLVDPHRVIVVR